jgi:hypothetical protein
MRQLNFLIIGQICCGLLFIVLIVAPAYAQGPAPTPTPVLCPPENEETPDGNNVCAYKRIPLDTVGTEHEPPVGAGGCSTFFDIPTGLLLKREGKEIIPAGKQKGTKYHRYNIIVDPEIEEEKRYERQKRHEPHEPYTGIRDILVMTEERAGKGEIGLFLYNLALNSDAELKLWLAKESLEPEPERWLNTEPDVIIRGKDEGLILSKEKIDDESRGKKYRKYRYVRSAKKLRVVKWEIRYKDNGVVKTFSDQGDDLYYFYLKFRT